MGLIRFAHQKKRSMPTRWDDDQKRLLAELWKDGSSFEDIASAVNDLIRAKAHTGGFNLIPTRTARAVAVQCSKLGLISREALTQWERQQRESLRIDRYTGLRQTRVEVLQRDGSTCVICRSSSELEFAHVIPFSLTRRNHPKESITLCKRHHRNFDDGATWCTKAVYQTMCEYYSEFESVYEITQFKCGKSSIRQKVTDA